MDSLFPILSIGEYAHMGMSEKNSLIDRVIDETKGRVDVVLGTGATCYHQSIELANYAKEKGCAGIVLYGPYFFKNSEEVVEGHFKKLLNQLIFQYFCTIFNSLQMK